MSATGISDARNALKDTAHLEEVQWLETLKVPEPTRSPEPACDESTHPSTPRDPYSYHELFKAALQCRRNVGWKERVTLWMDRAVENILTLERQLNDGTYRLERPIVFHIEDPKPRTISATHFRDRVVQRAICNCGGYDSLTRGLITDNCACQLGKGTSFAFRRLKWHMHRHYVETGSNAGYCIRLDIRKYFPSIPHGMLKETVAKCEDRDGVLAMLNAIIDDFVKMSDGSEALPHSKGFGVRGIGLGSQLSQLFALLYMSGLDHYIKETLKVRHYIRYMDDMVFLVRTREEAESVFAHVSDYIASLGLALNSKSCIFDMRERPIEFLKVMFTLDANGGVRNRLSRKALNRERNRLRALISDVRSGRSPIRKLIQHANTWSGFARHRCSKNQLKGINRFLRAEFDGFPKALPTVVGSEDLIETTNMDCANGCTPG